MVMQSSKQKAEGDERAVYQQLLEDSAAREAKLHNALEESQKMMNKLLEQREQADA